MECLAVVGVLQNGMKCLLEQAFHFLMHPTTVLDKT
jgi:hypothetical protein